MAAKVFEVGDVLPATTIAISGYSDKFGDNYDFVDVKLGLHLDASIIGIYDNIIWVASILQPYFTNGILDLSSFNEQQRTVIDVNHKDYSGDSYLAWEVVTGYSITFEENDGSTVTDLTDRTALPSPLPTTTKANHVFAGWYYDNLFTQKANAGDELEGNVTLYAKWYTPTSWCKDIADAIREKEGSSGSIKHVDFPERILAIERAVELTQAQYDALTTPDTNTYYIVVEEE